MLRRGCSSFTGSLSVIDHHIVFPLQLFFSLGHFYLEYTELPLNRSYGSLFLVGQSSRVLLVCDLCNAPTTPLKVTPRVSGLR